MSALVETLQHTDAKYQLGYECTVKIGLLDLHSIVYLFVNLWELYSLFAIKMQLLTGTIPGNINLKFISPGRGWAQHSIRVIFWDISIIFLHQRIMRKKLKSQHSSLLEWNSDVVFKNIYQISITLLNDFYL